MGEIRDIGVNLIAAVIGFLLAQLFRYARGRARIARYSKLWDRFARGELAVVVGSHTRPEFRSYEQSGLIGAGDVSAVLELDRHLRSIGVRYSHIGYSDQASGEQRDRHLVLIGGPDCNSVTSEVMGRLDLTLTFGSPGHRSNVIHDVTTRTKYHPSLPAPGAAVPTASAHVDYAVIVVARNPFARHNWVIIVAGSEGYGTWAAARLTASPAFIAHPLIRSGADLECLISVDVAGQTPHDVRVLEMRTLVRRA